jgi:creatinine amidohydrolase/Fe(II)-dependent formamide hydrolase-like protein/7-cyano-7-deazaguanine synthase in queuosine biosynthesis
LTSPSSPTTGLESLAVIDRLEVGPVKLEKNRLACPYTAFGPDGSDSTELIYKYEENVFDPNDKVDQNLAAVMAAQLALNYGLFCRRIVFHGSYDQADRRFLREMAVNTAREIYVKKLLEPNPFLLDEARNLPLIKQKSYLQAELEFSGPPLKDGIHAFGGDSNQYAVLSSGGKESLLSYSLLNELGHEVHPIFINESGRHWFTALNAHRHFSKHVPRTARVWTNTDRLFAWMLRHLPFIRKDFATVRSDEYPIRLWTVALLVFGAMPLMKKRGINRLIMGDEFDTTTRANYKGISHYDGLYDQSIFFDQALSRYYHRKGWNVVQFSMLRPLSELLIEKILVERYPELQQLQVSCHAAHKEDDRVRPCGKCEKCRRVVGMLTALGADPTSCGYSREQIDDCLRRFVREGVHQEAEAAQQTLFLLGQKGVLSIDDRQAAEVKPQPVVMKLRFDAVRSPVEGIPRDLRRPLFKLFLEHANESVRRSGRMWVDMDIMSDQALDRPHAFETTESGPIHGVGSKRPYVLGELSWPQAEARFSEVDLALLPVGAVEQHGPHLPLDTDAFDAEYLSMRVAEACSDPKPLVLPLIPYGVSYHHLDFAGTLSISPETLSKLVYEVGVSAARHGITKLVIINGHGGNSPALHFAAQMINRDAHIFTCVESGETSDTDIAELTETANDVHAGEIETSTTLHVRPDLVRMDQAAGSAPEFSSRYLDFSSKRAVTWYAHTRKISTTGVMGDPTKASPEKGEKIWEVMVRRLTEFVEDLKGMTLEEIHHRRY